jgi:hypothetical protein
MFKQGLDELDVAATLYANAVLLAQIDFAWSI